MLLEKRACTKKCRRLSGKRGWAGVACILLGVLILLVCAPDWLIAFLVSMLLFLLGFYCLGIGPR